MNKYFLIRVDLGDTSKLTRDDDFLTNEVEAYASALFKFYSRGDDPNVTCRALDWEELKREVVLAKVNDVEKGPS